MSEFTSFEPRTIVGAAALLAVLLVSLYLLMHERWLRRHLIDLQPDRRLLFLMHQWQLRNYQIIFALVLVGCLFIAQYPVPEKSAPKTVVETTPENPAVATDMPASDAIDNIADPAAVLGLFDAPDDSQTPLGASIENLKSRYENALIGAYILNKCTRTNDQEISTLLKALQGDIIAYQKQSANAPLDVAQLYASIVSSAKGGFEMIYNRTPCDSPEVDMLEQQFANFVLQYQKERN